MTGPQSVVNSISELQAAVTTKSGFPASNYTAVTFNLIALQSHPGQKASVFSGAG
jgi:hypothetical protein